VLKNVWIDAWFSPPFHENEAGIGRKENPRTKEDFQGSSALFDLPENKMI
jgi:hypothetical protein